MIIRVLRTIGLGIGIGVFAELFVSYICSYMIPDTSKEALSTNMNLENVTSNSTIPVSNSFTANIEVEGRTIEELEDYLDNSSVIRFHVRANSNEDRDQQLKLKVKDCIVTELNTMLDDVTDVQVSKDIIESNFENIKAKAKEVIVQEGYDYDVDVYMCIDDFPVKQYGDTIFPAGRYLALRIDIGKAQGKNWWCVMYPGLCVIDSSYALVDEETHEKLENTLTQEEYEQLYVIEFDKSIDDMEVEYHSAIWDGITTFLESQK